MGASLNGGIALNWLRDNFFQGNGYASLNRYIDDVPAGSDGLIFLPYLAGERSPHMDSKARAIFFGLTLRHNYKHFARAVMEGITFSLREAMEIFLELGISCEKVVASGGRGPRAGAGFKFRRIFWEKKYIHPDARKRLA